MCSMLTFLPAGLQLPGPHIGLMRTTPSCSKQHLDADAQLAVSSGKNVHGASCRCNMEQSCAHCMTKDRKGAAVREDQTAWSNTQHINIHTSGKLYTC